MNSLLEKLQPYLTLKTSIRSATESFVKLAYGWRDAERKFVMGNDDTLRKATTAELFSAEFSTPFYTFLILGMFARMLRQEVEAGNREPLVVQMAEEAAKRIEKDGTEFESQIDWRALPIRALVGVQVCAGLAAVEYLRDTTPTP
jgi:hypothetical protein